MLLNKLLIKLHIEQYIMKIIDNKKRSFLVAFLAAAASSSNTFAQNIQSNNKLILFGAPGTGIDMLGRRLKTIWSEQQVGDFHIENASGGGGMVAINRLLSEPANSNTLLLTTSGSVCVTPFISKAENFDPEQDLTPLAILAKTQFVLFVSSKSQFRSFEDVINFFKNKEHSLNYGVIPIYGASHLGTHALIQQLGINGKAIPYRQPSQLLLDVAEQRTHVGIIAAQSVKGMVDQKLLRPIVALSANRLQIFPDLPAMTELGLGSFSFEGWLGLFHQRQSTSSSFDKVRQSLKQIFAKNQSRLNLEDMGLLEAYKDTQIATDFVRNEIVRYRKIIDDMNL